jgi:hypothetical protein
LIDCVDSQLVFGKLGETAIAFCGDEIGGGDRFWEVKGKVAIAF